MASISGSFCMPRSIDIYHISDSSEICKSSACTTSPNRVASQLYLTVKEVADFFATRFEVCGVDGRGTIPPIFINLDEENAAFVCDSLGRSCFLQFHNDFAKNKKVVAHEYVHAITKELTVLGRLGQAGALAEHFSDAFATAYAHAAADSLKKKKDWQIKDLRDLSKHADMDSFKTQSWSDLYDNIDHVHHNSQIPSHAFYMAVAESNSTAYGKIASIWFKAFLTVESNETFVGFASKTLQIAPTKADQSVLLRAWIHVGVLQIPVPAPLPKPAQQKEVGDYKGAMQKARGSPRYSSSK